MFGNDHQQKTNAKAQLDDVLLYILKVANGGLQKRFPRAIQGI